jgi:hypothetical protein
MQSGDFRTWTTRIQTGSESFSHLILHSNTR